jgi:DNA-binding GntR family transcriptional regulator
VDSVRSKHRVAYPFWSVNVVYAMSLGPIRLRGARPRAIELYEALRSAILNGSLDADERLVEESIAAAAGVSRTPVREALHKLEVDGLVQATPRGMVVTRFSLEELSDLCSVREVLEGMASGLAAATMTNLELITLRGIQEQYREASLGGEIPRLTALNHAFHETIWHGSRNRYLQERLAVLRSQIERLQETTLATESRRLQALEEHDLIIDAIEGREGQTADQVTRAHFRKAMAIRLTNRRLAMGEQRFSQQQETTGELRTEGQRRTRADLSPSPGH